MIFLFTEIYIDTAEIGPMKVSLRFTVDIIVQDLVYFPDVCLHPCKKCSVSPTWSQPRLQRL